MEYFRVGFGGRAFVPTGHPVGYGHPGFGHAYHHPFGYGPRLWNRPYGYPYCECYTPFYEKGVPQNSPKIGL